MNYNSKKEDFQISNNTLVISTLGFVSPHKRLHKVLSAFAKFLKTNPNSTFLIIGSYLEDNYKKEIKDLITELKISDKVVETGFKQDLIPFIQISDIIIQTRYPTAGETSGMTLEVMRMGKPLIVSNVGWFSELPDDVSIKINVDSNEEKSIIDAFEKLSSNKDYREKLGLKAKNYIEKEHDPEKISYEIFDFLSQMSNFYHSKFFKNLSIKLNDLGINEANSIYVDYFSKKVHELI